MTAWITRTSTQSWGWRAFACIAVVVINAAGLGAGWKSLLLHGTASIGLAGYAFGFRLGTLFVWRAYAIIYAVFIALKLAQPIMSGIMHLSTQPLRNVPSVVGIIIVPAFFAFVILALFRHAEMTNAKATVDPTLAEVFS